MKHSLFMILIVVAVACTPSRERSINLINSTLEEVQAGFDSAKIDTANIKQAEGYIEDFVAEYPQDSMAPGFLFQLASVYQRQNNIEAALTTYEDVYLKYPRSNEGAQSVFLMGFIHGMMGNLEKSKEQYQLYIDQYGDRDAKMTNDARLEIERMGMTPDEIVEMFEKNAARDSTGSSN